MTLTESEFDLLCQENEQTADMIKAKLKKGECEIDGETYFPASINEANGEWYLKNNIDFTF